MDIPSLIKKIKMFKQQIKILIILMVLVGFWGLYSSVQAAVTIKPSVGSTKINTLRTDRLTNGLVGYWTMDGKDVTDKVYDRSGQSNNGYFYNGATSSAKVIGKVGQAMKFDGVNDYVNAGDIGNVNSSGMTVSFWTKINTITGTWKSFLGKATAGTTDTYQYVIGFGGTGNETKIGIHTSNAVGHYNNKCSYDLNAQTGKWIYITAVWTSTSCSVYLDGVSKVSQSATIGMNTGATHPLQIGRGYQSNSYAVDAAIDEVRIYNRALSASEVKQLYLMGK